jgi:hypothetical protein
MADRDHPMQQRACGLLEKNAHDLTLISAVLSGPAYLSDLNDAEFQFVRRRLEKHAPPGAGLKTAGHHPLNRNLRATYSSPSISASR